MTVLDFLGLGDSGPVEGQTFGEEVFKVESDLLSTNQGGLTTHHENGDKTSTISQAFMNYMGNPDHQASEWFDLKQDGDGEYSFDFVIEQVHLDAHKFFLKIPGQKNLKRFPNSDIKIDKDKDILMRSTQYFKDADVPNLFHEFHFIGKDAIKDGDWVGMFNYSDSGHKFCDGKNWYSFKGPMLPGKGIDFFYKLGY